MRSHSVNKKRPRSESSATFQPESVQDQNEQERDKKRQKPNGISGDEQHNTPVTRFARRIIDQGKDLSLKYRNSDDVDLAQFLYELYILVNSISSGFPSYGNHQAKLEILHTLMNLFKRTGVDVLNQQQHLSKLIKMAIKNGHFIVYEGLKYAAKEFNAIDIETIVTQNLMAGHVDSDTQEIIPYYQIHRYFGIFSGRLKDWGSKTIEDILDFFPDQQRHDLIANFPFICISHIFSKGSISLIEKLRIPKELFIKTLKYNHFEILRNLISGSLRTIGEPLVDSVKKLEHCLNFFKESPRRNSISDKLFFTLSDVAIRSNNKPAFDWLLNKANDEKIVLERLFQLNGFALVIRSFFSEDDYFLRKMLKCFNEELQKQLLLFAIGHVNFDISISQIEYSNTREKVIKYFETESDQEAPLKQKYIAKLKKSPMSRFKKDEIKIFDSLRGVFKERFYLRATNQSDHNQLYCEHVNGIYKIFAEQSLSKLYDRVNSLYKVKKHYNDVFYRQFILTRHCRVTVIEITDHLMESLTFKFNQIEPALQMLSNIKAPVLWTSTLDVKLTDENPAKTIIICGDNIHSQLFATLNHFVESIDSNILGRTNFAIGFISIVYENIYQQYVQCAFPIKHSDYKISHVTNFFDDTKRNNKNGINLGYIRNYMRDKKKACKLLKLSKVFNKNEQRKINLYHSEQAIFELLVKDPSFVMKYIQSIISKDPFFHSLAAIVLDIHTSNQPCQNCRLRALGLQNSDQKGGFISGIQKLLKDNQINYSGKNLQMLVRFSAHHQMNTRYEYITGKTPDKNTDEFVQIPNYSNKFNVDNDMDIVTASKRNRVIRLNDINDPDDVVIEEYENRVSYESDEVISLSQLDQKRVLCVPEKIVKRNYALKTAEQIGLHRFSLFCSGSSTRPELQNAYASICKNNAAGNEGIKQMRTTTQ